jgi:hypothetical protein
MTPSQLGPIRRRLLAEDLVRLRRPDEQRRYAACQRQGPIDPNPHQIDAVVFAVATLIPLAIAAHLQTAVVLDDQLVHSDGQRLKWFRQRLGSSVREHCHQVIVFTCRPDDYLPTGEAADDSVEVVDLETQISRHDEAFALSQLLFKRRGERRMTTRNI